MSAMLGIGRSKRGKTCQAGCKEVVKKLFADEDGVSVQTDGKIARV